MRKNGTRLLRVEYCELDHGITNGRRRYVRRRIYFERNPGLERKSEGGLNAMGSAEFRAHETPR